MMTSYLFYIVLGFFPSLVWLWFYLKKDSHPEPKKIVIKIFIYGILLGPLALVLEIVARWVIWPTFSLNNFLWTFSRGHLLFPISLIIIAPVVEEWLKYWLVKKTILKNSNFDEPPDLMIYAIIGALGFAAAENLLSVFMNFIDGESLNQIVGGIAIRFVSATFIHALTAGTIGYYMALSFWEPAKRYIYLTSGLALAIFFHASYNFIIWEIEINPLSTDLFSFAAILLLTFLSVYVSWQFQELKKKSAICKIK